MKSHIYPRTILLAVTAALLTALSSCDSGLSKGIDIESMVTAIPVQTEPDGRWGMMDINGHLIFENEFVDEPTMAVNGLFCVSEGAGLSLYAVGDQPKLVGSCEGLAHIGICNEGLVPVSSDSESISVVGTDGSERFRIGQIKNKDIVGCARLFNDGMLVVTDSEGLSGAIDANGKPAIVPKYTSLSDFSDGNAIARQGGDSAAYVVIDRMGNTCCTVKKGYKVISQEILDDEFVIADTAGHICIAHLNGAISKLPAKVKEVGDFNRQMLAFRAENELWGLMSRADGNQTLMRPKFRSLTILPGDRFLVNLDGHWSIIDLKGKTAIDLGDAYTEVRAMGLKGAIRYFAKDNVGWNLLDENGHEIHTDFNIYNVGFSTTIGDQPKAQGTTMSPERLAEQLIQLVTPNSLCDITLNTIANRWYKSQSPDDFADTNEFTPDSVPAAPNGCGFTLIGVTDRVIAVGMRFNATTQKVEYAFLPNNTINAVELDITTPIAGIYGKVKDCMLPQLQQMGYRLLEDTEEGVLMQSHYANLEITPTENDKSLTIIIYRL